MSLHSGSSSTGDGFVFNPDDMGYTADPYPTYRHLREEAPVYWWPEGRSWLLSRYHDVVAVMRDAARFTTNIAEWEYAPPYDPNRKLAPQVVEYHRLVTAGLLQLPPADHQRVRKLVSPAFTPRAIERMRVDVQAIVDQLLAAVREDGRLDVVTDVAEHLPIRAISRMLDIPDRYEASFRRFGTALVDSLNPRLGPDELAETLAPIPEGVALLHEVIEERRHHPGGDLLSNLIHAEEEGQKLSRDELVSLVAALVTAGSETTVHLVCFGTYQLLRHPEAAEALRRDPSLTRNALEETLRYDNFGKSGVLRVALEDVEIRGTLIRKRQLVMPLLPSAMRDPEVFPDADTFDIRRDHSMTVNFGSGAHFCLGAALARLEGEVAVNTMLSRYPRMRLAGEVRYAPHAFIRKMSTLPVQVA
ncbi:MAG TPA: cytochrome P450 [Polyangia bacterium]|jgi:cytochrome P450|nr:cytochrome P450 [Polyangia bacterium]